jgi:hypothetical protein
LGLELPPLKQTAQQLAGLNSPTTRTTPRFLRPLPRRCLKAPHGPSELVPVGVFVLVLDSPGLVGCSVPPLYGCAPGAIALVLASLGSLVWYAVCGIVVFCCCTAAAAVVRPLFVVRSAVSAGLCAPEVMLSAALAPPPPFSLHRCRCARMIVVASA